MDEDKREELLQFLRENLSISVDTFRDYYDSGVIVKLFVGNEEVSSSSFSFPSESRYG